jgi:glycosyltransferase involved in cell wall biosynthesis
MAILTAITTCKGRLEHLRHTLPALCAMPGLEIVVVDYDCPQQAGDWVRQAWPRARVVYAADRPFFNAAKARNLGAAAAATPWLFFVDADVLVTGQLLDHVLPRLEAATFMTPELRPSDLGGALVVAREDFERIGGYDEVFEGWGDEDNDIVSRLQFAGIRREDLPSALFECMEHDDALRVRYHRDGDFERNWAINDLYYAAKLDLMRQGVQLDGKARAAIYADVRRALEASPGAPATLQVAFRRDRAGRLDVRTSLVYEILSP